MIPMELKDKIDTLYLYLESNKKNDDAKRVEEIREMLRDESETEIRLGLKWLVSMCSVKYLGDVNIKEFDNPYSWWNFLGEISSLCNKILSEKDSN